MRNENSKLHFSRCAILLAFAATFSASSWAQEPTLRRVTLIHVKPDRVADFTAALAEYKTGLQKAGWDKTITWWRSLSGKGEFRVVRYFSKYSDLDAPGPQTTSAPLSAIFARSQSCVESTDTIIQEVIPDLSLPRGKEPPAFLRVLRTRVQPSKVDEYLALLKSDLMPAVRKSGMKAYSVARVRYGTTGPEFLSSSGLTGWGDLDGEVPLVKAMGQEAYQRYLSKRNTLIVETEAAVYRYLPELSYFPETKTSANKTGN